MLGNFLLGLLLILIMVVSSGVAVDVFEKLAHEIKVNKLMVTMILVGFSTSLPELFVGLAAALRSQPEISLGNIIGANLANLSWIIGGAAMLYGSIPVVGEYLEKEFWITIGMTMAPFLLMSDGSLNRLDGIVLIFLYLLYVNNMIRSGNSSLKQLKLSGRKVVVHRFNKKMDRVMQSIKLMVALGALGLSAWMLINLAVQISGSLGVSLFWIGMMVVAVGTTLPELILSLVASERREIALILGNVLGSVVVNSTLILGLIALVNPIAYGETLQRGVAGMFLIIILGLFWLFTKSKHKLERWEGAVLVGIYAMFVGLQLMLA